MTEEDRRHDGYGTVDCTIDDELSMDDMINQAIRIRTLYMTGDLTDTRKKDRLNGRLTVACLVGYT